MKELIISVTSACHRASGEEGIPRGYTESVCPRKSTFTLSQKLSKHCEVRPSESLNGLLKTERLPKSRRRSIRCFAYIVGSLEGCSPKICIWIISVDEKQRRLRGVYMSDEETYLRRKDYAQKAPKKEASRA